MKKFTLFYMVLVLAPNLFGLINAMNPKLADSINMMSMNYFKVALENEASNFICSPISIHRVLTALYITADENTRDEMTNILQFNEGRKPISLNHFDMSMNISNVNFNMAYRIFLTEQSTVHKFLREMWVEMKINSQKLDFSNAQMSAKTINNWVDKETNHTINDIISANDITKNSKLFLVNAIYFNATWQNQFQLLGQQPFFIKDYISKSVTTMYLEATLEIANSAELEAQIIKLPYKTSGENDEKVSMFIILPDSGKELKATQMNINNPNFNLSSLKFEEEFVSLFLPKFKLETKINGKNYLMKMGMKNAFNKNAQFPGLSRDPISINEILQKAFINVDEKGTEAGAATSVIIDSRMLTQPRPVKVNKPFLAILATEHVILFAARINDPTKN